MRGWQKEGENLLKNLN